MNRIDELTPAQTARMDEWADKWIEIGLRTGDADRPKFADAARRCYEAAGLPWHGNVVWVESPLVGAFTAPIAAHMLAGRAVRRTVHDAVNGAVGEAVSGAVRDAVNRAVNVAVRDEVHGAVGSAVHGAVNVAVRDAVGGAWHEYLGGQFWAGGWGWGPSFSSFFIDVCGLELSENIMRASRAYAETVESACWWWPHSHFIIACERPLAIHRELVSPAVTRGWHSHHLHCETGPAVAFRGWGVYAWHGTQVPAHWIEDKAHLAPAEVLAHPNVEVRAAGAAIIGWARMLSVLKAKVINDSGSDDIGQLIELTLPGLDEPGRFLKAVCPRNGIICEGVPRVSDIDGLPIETALHAQAWRIGDPLSDYQHPTKRT